MSSIVALLKHRSFQVLCAVLLYFSIAGFLPDIADQGLYASSLFIKDLLMWLLPVSVCLFIASAVVSFEKKAPLFILALFAFEAISNSASVWYAFGCGHLVAGHIPTIETHAISDSFSPLWRLTFLKTPSWWSADKGTFAGIALGVIATFRYPALKHLLATSKRSAEWVLTRFFARLIPLFVLGFVARMYKTKVLSQMFAHYADLILWLVLFLVVYIVFLFFVGSGKSLSALARSIRNLLPATGIAFSSGCSLSTMPWTIEGTSRNLQNPELAKSVIPATTNIQQIGDCIINSWLCFLIYFCFKGHAPSLATWIPFTLVFVLARYATAAVLGGAIFIMIPIYENYLSFTPEMIALILAFNVILDPLVTCSNVMANGALCRIFEQAWLAITRKKVPSPSL
jgi:Na+/H+-dicarboxylate symporter